MALATRSSLIAHADRAVRLVGVGLGVEVLAAVAVTTAMLERFAAPATTRCESGASLAEVVVVFSTLLAPVAGGIVVAAISADARRGGGILVRHLAAGTVAVVVPLATVVEAVVFGLTCSGR